MYVYIYINICIYLYTYIYTYVRVYTVCMYVYISVHVWYIYVCTHLWVDAHVASVDLIDAFHTAGMCIYMICIYMNIHIYTHICIKRTCGSAWRPESG